MNLGSFSNVIEGIQRVFSLILKKFSKQIAVAMVILIPVIASLTFSTKAVAIDQIMVKYRGLNVSVTLTELVDFANTGTVSKQLNSIFQIANATPQNIKTVREIFAYKVKVDPRFLDDLLNSYYGKLVLGEVSKFVTPGSDTGKAVQDVISTIRMSTQDGNISLLEIAENYKGTNAIIIDGEKVVQLYQDAMRIGNEALAYLRKTPEVKKFLCTNNS
ncbi:MAG: hypothetical protein RLZZ338_3646 [Cyanobacteriota bacterium]|jgi:hypothetical protein